MAPYIQVNPRAGNGLVPDSTQPLFESMLTKFCDITWYNQEPVLIFSVTLNMWELNYSSLT